MDKKLIRDEALSLEGDGIIPKIYNLLTYKDPICGTMPSICLPDTIMFSYDIPEVWYFGNSKGVRRKLKINVTLENIEKAFSKDVSKHGIVAQYIALSPDQKTTPLTFTYIRKDELRSFLYNKKPNGILQRFVNPKGLNNFVLKVNWSPNFCLFEKVENLMKLDDETVDLYHRAMTLEGRDYQTRTMPLRGSVLPHKLEKLAYHVSHHIKNATMENVIIARMTLVFKIDDEGRLWFLYCTNLRVQPHENQIHENQYGPGNSLKPTNLNINLSSPSSINAYKSVFPKTKSLKKVYTCQNCDKDLDTQQFFNIQLYQVINEYENDRQIHYTEEMRPQKKVVKKYGVSNIPQARPEEINVNDATIPRVVTNLYPEIKQAEFEVLRREPGFLYQEVKVCEDCYLKFSNNFEYVQDPKAIMKEYETFNPKGTGGLRPEIIDRRRLATKAHGKIKATQLGSMLRITKQRMCAPTDSYDVDRSESRERPGKEFNAILIQAHEAKKVKPFLHNSVLSPTKEISQPKIPEENLTDQSIEKPEETGKLKLTWSLEKRPRKVATSQVVKRNQTVSRSPDTTEPVFLRSFYQSKSIMSHDKMFMPILSPVGSKKKLNINKTETLNQDSTTINPHALTMTSFRQTGKINDDNDWQASQAKSKERVLKVYGSKAFNNLMSNLKKESSSKMPKLPWND